MGEGGRGGPRNFYEEPKSGTGLKSRPFNERRSRNPCLELIDELVNDLPEPLVGQLQVDWRVRREDVVEDLAVVVVGLEPLINGGTPGHPGNRMVGGIYRHQGCGSDLYNAGPDLDPDTTFHFDADPDPDPTLSFKHVLYPFFYSFHSNVSLHCFILLVRC